MHKIVLKVPRINSPDPLQYEFIQRVKKEFNAGNNLLIDFNNLPVVSSLVIGIVFFVLKKNPERVQFVNISRSLHESLQSVVGQFANKLVDGFDTPT